MTLQLVEEVVDPRRRDRIGAVTEAEPIDLVDQTHEGRLRERQFARDRVGQMQLPARIVEPAHRIPRRTPHLNPSTVRGAPALVRVGNKM